MPMLRTAFPLALLLAAALPAAAQDAPTPPVPDTEQGLDLLEQGTRLILRGLMSEMEPALKDMGRALDQMGPAIDEMGQGLGKALADLQPMATDLMALIDDLGNYQTPEILPNGDIIIRRKPDLPDPPKDGEIDL